MRAVAFLKDGPFSEKMLLTSRGDRIQFISQGLFPCPVVNPVRGLSQHSLPIRVNSSPWLVDPAARGARGGVENGGFCMLSGVPPASGARNALFIHMPTSPESFLHRPPQPLRGSADFFHSPWTIFPTSTSIRWLLNSYESYGVFEGLAFS